MFSLFYTLRPSSSCLNLIAVWQAVTEFVVLFLVSDVADSLVRRIRKRIFARLMAQVWSGLDASMHTCCLPIDFPTLARRACESVFGSAAATPPPSFSRYRFLL